MEYLQQHNEVQEWHTNLVSWLNCITGWKKQDGVITISYQGEGRARPVVTDLSDQFIKGIDE